MPGSLPEGGCLQCEHASSELGGKVELLKLQEAAAHACFDVVAIQ